MSIDFQTAISQIRNDDLNKMDIMTQTSMIRMDSNGRLVANGMQFDMSDNAMSQVFGRYNMPVLYEKRLLEMNPELVADQFNFLLKRSKNENPSLLRFRRHCNTNELRAFLSNSYSAIDNNEIFETLGDIMGGMEDLEVESFYLDDNRSRMRIIIPSMERSVGVALKKNDIIKVGFDVINSETGRASLQISPVVYRLVCTNGLKAWQQEGDVFKQRHSYARNSELKTNMKKAISNSIRTGDALLEAFAMTKEIDVDDPMETIKLLSKKKEYSEKFIELTQDNWRIEPEPTMYGVINAFTRSAQSLDDERRIDVEKFAGTLVKISK